MKRAALVLLLASGCIRLKPSRDDLDSKTTELEQFMTQEQVREILGPPDNTKGSLCGGLVGEKWKCVIWVYEVRGQVSDFRVTFQRANRTEGPWVVNGWE